MDTLFDSMLDILNGESDIDISEEELSEEEDIIIEPDINIIIDEHNERVKNYIDSINVMNPEVAEKFENEIIYVETDLFTKPVSTTITIEGQFLNVDFHEKDLVERVFLDDRIVGFISNYGKLLYEGYTEPVKERKTNRGRKKKEKKKKNRKKQGTGTSFNSQKSFIVKSFDVDDLPNGTVPYGAKVYKFKIFRNGRIQLPGLSGPECIYDVINCAKEIERLLNLIFFAGSDNAERVILDKLYPVMKNYKFVLKIPDNHMIDLLYLRDLLIIEQNNQKNNFSNDAPSAPKLYIIKYSRQDTKLAIRFKTPNCKKPNKNTLVNIFMSGKINILGADDSLLTYQICDYLHWLIKKYQDDIIIQDGLYTVTDNTVQWEFNIDTSNTDHIFDYYDSALYRELNMSDETIDSIFAWIDDLNEEISTSANAILEYYLGIDE